MQIQPIRSNSPSFGNGKLCRQIGDTILNSVQGSSNMEIAANLSKRSTMKELWAQLRVVAKKIERTAPGDITEFKKIDKLSTYYDNPGTRPVKYMAGLEGPRQIFYDQKTKKVAGDVQWDAHVTGNPYTDKPKAVYTPTGKVVDVDWRSPATEGSADVKYLSHMGILDRNNKRLIEINGSPKHGWDVYVSDLPPNSCKVENTYHGVDGKAVPHISKKS